MAMSSSEAHFESHNQGFQVGHNEGRISTTLTINNSAKTDRIDFKGRYANSAIRPVVNHVRRPILHEKIKAQLHDTKEKAENTRILVVWGLGGSGKTQLVLDYIQEYRQDYSATFWIEAGQKESIERDYAQIDRLLFNRPVVAAKSSSNIADGVTAVKSWFHNQIGRSLVVFDSADTIDNPEDSSYIDLPYFLPDAPSVDVIITTRSSQAKDMTPLDDVGVAEMEPLEAAELFRKCAKLLHAQDDIEKEVESIVNELGNLALAITLAGSFVSETPRLSSDIRQYLPEYRQRRKKLLGLKARKYIDQYGESVLSTWETSFSAVAKRLPFASRLLSLLAFLNFDDIFLDLFGHHVAQSMPQPRSCVDSSVSAQRWRSFISPDASIDLYAFESAFAVLQTYSLVQFRHDQCGYAMHKLVHAWAYERLDLDQQRNLSFAALQLLVEVASALDRDPNYKMRLIPHVMANFSIFSHVYSELNPNDLEVLDCIDQASGFLYDVGRWPYSYELQKFHFTKMNEILGNQDPHTLISMNNLAVRLLYQGRHQEAEQMLRQVVKSKTNVLGAEHPETLGSMNNLAIELGGQGRHQKAEQMHRQVLKSRTKILGAEHPDTLISMNNLAMELGGQDRHQKAEQMHRQVLKSRTKVLGAEHPDTMSSMNNIGAVLGQSGSYQEAEKIYRSTLILSEKIRGGEHPHTLDIMQDLASVLGKQGNHKEAEKIFQQTLILRTKILGLQHPETLKTMYNLAVSLMSQDKDGEAEKLFRDGLELRTEILGLYHHQTVKSRSNLIISLRKQGKYEEAGEICREALSLYERVFGMDRPEIMEIRENLIMSLHRQGKYEEAENMCREALSLYERVFSVDRGETVWIRGYLVSSLRKQGKYEETDEMWKEVLSLYERVFGVDSPQTIWLRIELIYLLLGQDKDEEAENMCRKTLMLYEKREKSAGLEHDYDIVQVRRKLIRLLRKEGRDEEAERMGRETLNFCEEHNLDFGETVSIRKYLIAILSDQNRDEEAESMSREVLRSYEKNEKSFRPDICDDIAWIRWKLIGFLRKEGRDEEAERICREILNSCEESGLNFGKTIWIRRDLIHVLLKQDEDEEAEKICQEALSLYEKNEKSFRPDICDDIAWIRCKLIGFLRKEGKDEEAELICPQTYRYVSRKEASRRSWASEEGECYPSAQGASRRSWACERDAMNFDFLD